MAKQVLQLVVFGARGPTGKIRTWQALLLGYFVTGVTRRPEQSRGQHGDLRVVYGVVYDLVSGADSIKGPNVVAPLVGLPGSWKPMTIYSQSTRANLVDCLLDEMADGQYIHRGVAIASDM
jgi:hypothetical protein